MKAENAPSSPAVLIATLGGQPQIVTFTLDLLLARQERVDQVVVVYLPGHERYQQAYRQLTGEFSGDRYRFEGSERPLRLRSQPVRRGEQPLVEVSRPEEIEAVRQVFTELLADLKQQGFRVHLSLSGGRRVMALTALAAAMQRLTPADRLWHLYTPPDLTEAARGGALLHAPPGSGLRLVEVPFVPWAAYFPGLRPLLEGKPAALQAAWLPEEERQRCHKAWQQLTPRQQEVLRQIAAGQSRSQAAQRLSISPATFDTHRKEIIRRCAQAWGERRRAGAGQRIPAPAFSSFPGRSGTRMNAV